MEKLGHGSVVGNGNELDVTWFEPLREMTQDAGKLKLALTGMRIWRLFTSE